MKLLNRCENSVLILITAIAVVVVQGEERVWIVRDRPKVEGQSDAKPFIDLVHAGAVSADDFKRLSVASYGHHREGFQWSRTWRRKALRRFRMGDGGLQWRWNVEGLTHWIYGWADWESAQGTSSTSRMNSFDC